jgi:hypothetical protein
MTEEQSLELAKRGISSLSADSFIRQPKKKDETLELSDEDLADTVTVVCYSDAQPWTHERPLEQGEKATVPRKVAKIMEANHQVTIIE